MARSIFSLTILVLVVACGSEPAASDAGSDESTGQDDIGDSGPLFDLLGDSTGESSSGDTGESESETDTTSSDSTSSDGTTEGSEGDEGEMMPTEPELKVAFIGDQGLGPNAIGVMDMVEAEGADFVIHVGDFDYASLPPVWDAQINLALADDYPYFAALGNHDVDAWPLYRDYLETRFAKIEGAECDGELGAQSSCHYKGLHFLLSGVGTYGDDHEAWITDTLMSDDSIWSICAWHKNQNDMQAGGKGDEVGWEAYKACQDNGAIIVTGHEHSYSRTLTLTDLGNVAGGHGATGSPEQIVVTEGSTVVIVSGLGGVNSRDYIAAQHDDDTWWASIWTNNYYLNNGVVVPEFEIDFGALFIDFNVGGDPYKAHGYFKTTGGLVIDEFDITRE